MNFEELGRKVRKFSRDTMEEVQKMNEVRQLNGRINEEQKKIQSLYAEIGKKLYEQYKEEALAGFEAEIHAISDKFIRIAELKEQIRNVKGVVLCPCCNMEVSATERFCSNCGNKMPEVFEIVDEEEAAKAVTVESTDVTQTVEETAEDTAEEAAEAVEAVKEKTEEDVEAVKEKTEAAAEAVEEKAETVAEAVEETAEDAVEAVKEKAEDIAEAVTEKAEDIAEAVTEKAEEAAEAVKEKTEAAAEAVEEKAETVAEAVAEPAEDATEK